jgi:hypothetical protein
VELDLPTATFVVELDDGVEADPDAFRKIVESWGTYAYEVGAIETLG